MKNNNIFLFLLILLASLVIIGSVSAEDSSDIDLASSEIDEISNNGDYVLAEDAQDEIVSDDCCEEELSTGKTWYVEPDAKNPNQVQAPTVQPIIDQASEGDTIVLNGTFVHCHFMINKTLNIIATPGTSVGVCPHHTHEVRYHTGPTIHGVFYISPEASGTVIDGFSFTNDFYHIANYQQNPFAVYIDGASNVELKNLVVNWQGVKMENSEWDPKDFIFTPIVIKNAVNVTLSNLFINNTLNSVIIDNSYGIKIINSTIINSVDSQIFYNESSKNVSNNIPVVLNSKISAVNLNIKAGDSSNLQITLKDENNNPLASKQVSVIIEGVIKTVTTDAQGSATLALKYASAGTYNTVVSFIGDDTTKASITTAKITVVKKATSITAPKNIFKVKATKKVKITLKSGNTLLKSKKVTIKVNGKTFKATTNAKGVATVKVTLNKKGTFTYTAKFAGDGAYKTISKKGKIVVKK